MQLIGGDRKRVWWTGNFASLDASRFSDIMYYSSQKRSSAEGSRDRMKHRRPRPLSYSETVRFHGHDGPFLALGYRLGKFLMRLLKPRGIMDLKITVKTKMKKPYTCILDGLQCATFATLGKGNLAAKHDT